VVVQIGCEEDSVRCEWYQWAGEMRIGEKKDEWKRERKKKARQQRRTVSKRKEYLKEC